MISKGRESKKGEKAKNRERGREKKP